MLNRKVLGQWLVVSALMLMLLPLTTGVAHAAPGIAEPFQDHYNKHQGPRMLGQPLTGLVQANGYPAQYFEKGRLEDHRRETSDPTWAFMYGNLTFELTGCDPIGQVESTNYDYTQMQVASDPKQRHLSPVGFTGGTMLWQHSVFVPFDYQLRPAPGYVVPPYFWQYINRADLFPDGWLHDVGLPVMDVAKGFAWKQGGHRDIKVQAFERAILTYDPQNPPDWRVERANIGADAVRRLPQPRAAGVEIPANGAKVTLPLHILARIGQPCEQITAKLTWRDGTHLSHNYTLRKGEDWRGLLIDSLDWPVGGSPPKPKTQQATLELIAKSGTVLAHRTITILSPNDPSTQEITLYWWSNENLLPTKHRIPKTASIGTATLEEMLWGPGPRFPDLSTSIPLPTEILSHRDHYPQWGPRVKLRGLAIKNGVATPNFSREIGAYGGGSGRVRAIRLQVEQTLKQLPSVHKVVIAVEGKTEGVLEP